MVNKKIEDMLDAAMGERGSYSKPRPLERAFYVEYERQVDACCRVIARIEKESALAGSISFPVYEAIMSLRAHRDYLNMLVSVLSGE